DGRALVHMPLTPDKTDHDGAIHEGALAALLDTTGAMASWSIAGLDLRYKASTIGIHVSYHAPARDEVTAEASTWRRNDEIFLNQVTVSERGSGRVVFLVEVGAQQVAQHAGQDGRRAGGGERVGRQRGRVAADEGAIAREQLALADRAAAVERVQEERSAAPRHAHEEVTREPDA